MEDPPIAIHPPHNPKKRLFTGNSSSSFVDPDVIEIPPPAVWKSKPPKHKSVHEVIIVDDEDSDDVVIIEEKIAPNSKGKKPMLNYLGVNDVKGKNGFSSSQANGFVKGNSISFETVIPDELSVMDYFNSSYDDECAMLQAHFDSMDIPSGIEATVPWWPASTRGEKHAVSTSSYSVFGQQPYPNLSYLEADQLQQQWGHTVPFQTKIPTPKPNFNPTMQLPPVGRQIGSDFNMQTSGMISHIPPWFQQPGFSHQATSNSNITHKLPPLGMTSTPLTMWHGSQTLKKGQFSATSFPSEFDSGYSAYVDPSVRLDANITAEISPPSTGGNVSGDDISKKLECFQRFDSVEDHSDHQYNNQRESSQPKIWKKKIFAEWDMLKKDLPDTIFVRIYETRLELLRAAILGADGTPYHDGLFFFDVHFTSSYPAGPPHVKYHAHGLRINPNLYNCGKVCLSLLGTWSGQGIENWRPGKSNMLQVLVSIQALILNAEPYYNEPGFSRSKNSSASKKYSENAFLLSLKTMMYTMKNPPKHFEDLVYGHFYKRAHDILAACRAYLNGVQVGSFIKGKTLDSQKTGKTCSPNLKASLPSYIKSLVEAFTKIGVKDCNQFLVPVETRPNLNQPFDMGHMW